MSPHKLPPEILDEIIRLTPQQTQLVLCRTSHLLHSLTIRSLYKKLSLTTASSLMQLCTTLRSDSNVAAHVKSLTISYIPSQPTNATYLAPFYNNLKAALQQLLNLRELVLFVYDPTFLSTLFSQCQHQQHQQQQPLKLPSLRHFATSLPLTNRLLSFIRQHPKLNYLEVSHFENFSDDNFASRDCAATHHQHHHGPQPLAFQTPTTCKPILPKLHHFVGNSIYLETLSPLYPLTSLRSAYIIWNATQACEGPITALSKACCVSPSSLVEDTSKCEVAVEKGKTKTKTMLSVLGCKRRGWNADLIGCVSVSAGLSGEIKVLDVLCKLVLDVVIPTGYKEEVGHYLSRFRKLKHLRITREVQFRSSRVQADLDFEQTIVTDWGISCPSLLVISLPHSHPHVEWRRVSENVWAPIDLTFEGLAARWLKNPSLRRKYARSGTLKQIDNLVSSGSVPILVNPVYP